MASKTLGQILGRERSKVDQSMSTPILGSGGAAFKPPKEGFNPPLDAINEVDCEITCKALDTKNVRETMISIFHELSSYSWVNKAVITLSSLALFYGDFWRLGLLAITKPSDVQKIQVYGVLNAMIKATLSMTECIVEFEHDSKDVPKLSTATTSQPTFIKSSSVSSLARFSSPASSASYKGNDLLTFARKVNMIYHTIKRHYEDYKQKKVPAEDKCDAADFRPKVDLSQPSILIKIYIERKFHEECYEIVWVPIIEQECKDLNNHALPNTYQQGGHQDHEGEVVVLARDHRDCVGSPRKSMMRLWGWDAFPFTELVGASLWSKPGISWFELLLTDMAIPKINEAIKSQRYILLYGAEDNKAIYEIEEPVKKIIEDGVPIAAYNVIKNQLFWSHLESLMLSKLQTKADVHEPLMQDILCLYTNFKKDGGFALLTRGSQVVINDSIIDVTKVLSQYETTWKKQVKGNEKTFDAAFKEHRERVFVLPRCHHFCIPNMVGYIPEYVKCPVCPRMMRNIVKFECCHGAH
ncbi:hypothetical protein ACJRO7_029848 [Eucalyptus globulus]|uniref:Uncharacterized protein n=1 Tax=Eucalyptus globulus TaxID=34317 RepID=A0ABD3JER9_EUCGL